MVIQTSMKVIFGKGIGYREVEKFSSVGLKVTKDYGVVRITKEVERILESVTDDFKVYAVEIAGIAMVGIGNLVDKYKIVTLYPERWIEEEEEEEE